MHFLVIGGVALTISGLCLLFWCVGGVISAKRKGLSNDEMNIKIQKAVTWNLAAMLLSGLGLAVLIVGLIL